LFHKIDLNKNGQISEDEVRAFLVGIEAGVVGLIGDHCVSKVMAEFDFSGDHGISKEEFIGGISKWLDEANGVENNGNQTELFNSNLPVYAHPLSGPFPKAKSFRNSNNQLQYC
jgi:Ca2+-binding EF-hand superfamily protein